MNGKHELSLININMCVHVNIFLVNSKCQILWHFRPIPCTHNMYKMGVLTSMGDTLGV